MGTDSIDSTTATTSLLRRAALGLVVAVAVSPMACSSGTPTPSPPSPVDNRETGVPVRGDVAPDAAAASDGAKPTGCAAQARYTTLTPPGPNSPGDPPVCAAGRVLDNRTGLTWTMGTAGAVTHTQAETYCAGQGMRLPTKDEALGISLVSEALSGASTLFCAFPCGGWLTWTSSSDSPGYAWEVHYRGGTQHVHDWSPTPALCVQ